MELPKYLTQEIAQAAVTTALRSVMWGDGFGTIPVKRQDCHVVILVPAGMEEDGQHVSFDRLTSAYPLYQESYGEPTQWTRPYDKIALRKAMQLWQDRNDGRSGIIPHLLFSGDTPYYGGVKRQGIVVACSGVEPWFDELISGIVADTIIALVRHAYENDPNRVGKDFLD